MRFSRAVASLVGLAVADWVGAALEFLEAYRGAWGIAGKPFEHPPAGIVDIQTVGLG